MQSKQSNQFDYLLPSPQLQSISTHRTVYDYIANDIIETVNNQTKRKVFQKVHFFTNQIAQIEKFRQFASGKISQKVPDKTILRYLYSMDFKYEETLTRLQMYLDWYNDPVIQRFDNNTRQIINSGFIYTYGRDKAHRPIIYMNLGKMDMKKHALQSYYSAVNAVVTLVVQYMFIKGKLEVYNFVIDTNQKSLSLPLKMCLNVMDKLGTVYSMRLGKMLILNVNFAIKMMYGAATPFIHPITQAKIKLLSKSDIQQGKMTEFIDMNQLQQKYGGFRQNLTVNWPPSIPGQKQRNQTKYLMQYSFTQYFSVQNDADYFSEVDLVSHEFPQGEANGCCTDQQCIIF